MNQFTLLFHPLCSTEHMRIDFKSEDNANNFIELSKLDGYKMYHYIQSDFTYNMPIEDLEIENIGFKKLYREKKTWFGLSKKTITDLLIEPKEGFYYPYQYGNYLYIFTKQDINLTEVENWLDKEFQNRFSDINETFSEFMNLLKEDDYLIATNHDYQEQFGVIGKSAVIEQIISKFNKLKLIDYEIEKYEL